MDLRILIPVKPLGEGKSRLAPVLDEQGRRALCDGFVRHTLEMATGLAPTLVVTRDPGVAAIAGAAKVIAEPPGADLNAALDAGRRAVLGADALLILPIDLPRLHATTLQRLWVRANHIVLVPDRSRTGTNLLLLPRAAIPGFRFAYGTDSFAAHQAEAKRLGIPLDIVDEPEAAFDVDAPEDYAELTRCLA